MQVRCRAAAIGTLHHALSLQRRWHRRYRFPCSSYTLPVLDKVAIEDERLDTVRHVVKLVSKSESGMLDVSHHKNKDVILEVATQYPGMFNVVHDEYSDEENPVPCIQLTPEMEKLYKDESQAMRSRDQGQSINVLRKLLMIAKTQQILLAKLTWVRREFGLPKDFERELVHPFPNFFKVGEGMKGPVVKLASWDQNLAVTAREKTRPWNFNAPKTGFHLVDFPLTDEYQEFQELPFPSPYEVWQKGPDTVAEKRSVAMFHELLSFTPKKRTALSTLSLFRSEMILPKNPLFHLLRHPGIFYVSRAVEPPVIFLREAFLGSELKFKGAEDFIRERYLILMQRRPLDS